MLDYLVANAIRLQIYVFSVTEANFFSFFFLKWVLYRLAAHSPLTAAAKKSVISEIRVRNNLCSAARLLSSIQSCCCPHG